MAISIGFYTFYLALLGFVATLVSEYLFHTLTHLRLIHAKAELEAVLVELKSLSRDKRGQRKKGKLSAKINMLYTSVKKYSFFRTFLLLVFYTAGVVAVFTRQVVIPSRCPIPLLTAPLETPNGGIMYVTSSAIVLALSFLSSMFIVREDLVGLLMLKLLWRRTRRELHGG
ncbi:hypothetical protein PYJP_08630 [Pyrofollis japonicus]|uniref:hypothetical protein n=1 Tax=Pyrofollis japonicus TaxID=3060460 RepID=UPI00295BB529|nr:hypothetical protein [Pyrofollis japonicus]BEP17511.1 hypothetical protein PYJP_08630 [Pyrofollis japonicus]